MILITGGMGFIGLNLARYLVDIRQKVLLISRRAVQPPTFLEQSWNNDVKGVPADILELPNLFNLIKEYSVESIIHCAAAWEGSGSLYQILKIDLEGTTNILEAARVFGLRRVTFISSATVYLGSKAELLTEDVELPVQSPKYIFGVKKAGEQICRMYADQYGLSVPIARVSRVYGPLSKSKINPLEIMVRNAVAHKSTDLSHLWAESSGNYVYARDLAKQIALIHLSKAPKYSIYNVGDIAEHTLSEIASAVRKEIPDAEIHLGTTRTGRDLVFAPMDITRIREEMGYVPDYDLERGIRNDINWVRDGRYGG